ncbi:phosphoglycerate mutase [Mixta theicola]|uniref:Phosphoglycerate mutase n=1 Tax=Mixta theicola TaxID=1458355 RepID=A0A2K1QB56_9GAMM|nr:histidine phosphatase family protein [Mixta theicola]PNS12262.1 phosphoglycerate mutase [Mixta theicola]GLR08017.1 phosphoglycerate mutase [Mixta theicola]
MKKWIAIFMLLLTCGASAAAPLADDPDAVTVWFARHGKTWLNTLDRVQGWADSPLTDEGVQVARYLGEGLKTIPFDSYYSGDAGRQRETMQIIRAARSDRSIPTTEIKALREVFFGGFEGLPNHEMIGAVVKKRGLSDISQLFAEMKQGKLTLEQYLDEIADVDQEKLAERGGEVKMRMQSALRTTIKNAQERGEKNVLVVSSGAAILAMIADLTDDARKNQPLANAAVVKLVYQQGALKVTEIGNMQYVEAGKAQLAP